MFLQVNDLGLVPNMGNFAKYISVLKRVKTTKKLELLALGGSITAGGYFMEFVRSLKENEGLDVTVHNHGHGATEITCKFHALCCALVCCTRLWYAVTFVNCVYINESCHWQ
jgi:hypothetical protein